MSQSETDKVSIDTSFAVYDETYARISAERNKASGNNSEINPVEYRVLVKPEKIEETDPVLAAAKAAGIELPKDPHEREQMAQQRGTVVAVGGNAFSDWRGLKPEVGQRVMFAKYAGYNVKGADDELYRVLNDKDISAVIGKAVLE